MTHIRAHLPRSTCRGPGELRSAFEAFVVNPHGNFCTSPFCQLGELCLSDPPTVPLLTVALGAALASWVQGSVWVSTHRHTASPRSGNDSESQVRGFSPCIPFSGLAVGGCLSVVPGWCRGLRGFAPASRRGFTAARAGRPLAPSPSWLHQEPCLSPFCGGACGCRDGERCQRSTATESCYSHDPALPWLDPARGTF